MVYFDIGDERYHLRHHDNNDSRTVVKCNDFDSKVLLTIDRGLNITDHTGAKIGHMWVHHLSDMWMLHTSDGNSYPLQARCDGYEWQQILIAGVEASKILLKGG